MPVGLIQNWEPPSPARSRRPVIAPVEHFGERILHGKYGFKLTRELYAIPKKRPSVIVDRTRVTEATWARWGEIFEDDDHTMHTDEFIARWEGLALENFDLNMAFFAQIDPETFEQSLQEMVAKSRSLRSVTDLRSLDGEEGIYVLVLDEYRQAYIGQSTDIRKRIKSHWSGTKAFDRLIWGDAESSVLSIDSFRALDTTRIFAARTVNANGLETKLVKTFPADYLLNRINGGLMTGFRALFIEGEIKKRQLPTSANSDGLSLTAPE